MARESEVGCNNRRLVDFNPAGAIIPRGVMFVLLFFRAKERPPPAERSRNFDRDEGAPPGLGNHSQRTALKHETTRGVCAILSVIISAQSGFFSRSSKIYFSPCCPGLSMSR